MRFLQLTLLTPDFLPEVLRLDQQCFGGLWSQSAYEREIDSPNSILVGLVAKDSSPEPRLDAGLNQRSESPQLLALGCLWAICEEAHVTLLAVHPQYRRQSLGQAILVEMLNWAQQRGQEWAALEVRASNTAAIRLYDTFGFHPVGRRRRYYADTGEDAQILWRKGLQTPEFARHLVRWRQQIRSRLAQHGWGLHPVDIDLSGLSR